MTRRERTGQLIELGGLVAKSGIIDLVDDDRAIILGALLDITVLLQADDRDEMMTLWRRRGKRAFDTSTA
ncbi:conjugal transfer protein TraD [Sphingomonas sp. GB1N7]|uniref:conjugal transfer protein TraD n=1 Tax=Parasphingomonas caseinilytica TaxID=3096158 RepID=UPI002FC5AE46